MKFEEYTDSTMYTNYKKYNISNNNFRNLVKLI